MTIPSGLDVTPREHVHNSPFWRMLADEIGYRLAYVGISRSHLLALTIVETIISSYPKLVAVVSEHLDKEMQ